MPALDNVEYSEYDLMDENKNERKKFQQHHFSLFHFYYSF
jgi:hypothetical protein